MSSSSQDYRFGYVLPFEFNPGLLDPLPKPEYWCRFLESQIANDEDRLLLEQMLGYSMTEDTTKHHMLIKKGEAASGKSTCAYFFKRLLGPELAIEESLKRILNEPAHAANIVEMRACISTESKFDLKDLEPFKALIAFEGVSIHIYYVGKKTVPHSCKFLCCTNNEGWLPNSPEIRRRIRVVNFRNPISGEEQDPNLVEKFWNERDLIAHRLLARYFEIRNLAALPMNDSTDQFLRTAEDNINPVAAWARELELASGQYWRPIEFLLACYSEASGDTRMHVNEFGRRLREAGLDKGVGDKRTYTRDNREFRRRGVSINNPLLVEWKLWTRDPESV